MDWKEDPWFVKYHYDKLTEEFKDWWLGYYGPSTQFDDENERHEYWVRCAFAPAGWSAARKKEEAFTMSLEEAKALRCKVPLEQIIKQINLGVKWHERNHGNNNNAHDDRKGSRSIEGRYSFV